LGLKVKVTGSQSEKHTEGDRMAGMSLHLYRCPQSSYYCYHNDFIKLYILMFYIYLFIYLFIYEFTVEQHESKKSKVKPWHLV